VKAEEENQIALIREFDFNTASKEAESSG